MHHLIDLYESMLHKMHAAKLTQNLKILINVRYPYFPMIR